MNIEIIEWAAISGEAFFFIMQNDMQVLSMKLYGMLPVHVLLGESSASSIYGFTRLLNLCSSTSSSILVILTGY